MKLVDPYIAATENALPGVAFIVLHESLQREGTHVREDLVTFAQRAVQAQLHDKDVLYINTVVAKATDAALKLVKAANADTLPQAWVAMAHAVLKARARGVAFDNNLVLLALGIETDVAEFPEDYGGAQHVDKLANRIDNEARRLGFWIEQRLASAVI